MVVSTRRPPPGVEDSKCKPRAIRSRRTVLPNEGTNPRNGVNLGHRIVDAIIVIRIGRISDVIIGPPDDPSQLPQLKDCIFDDVGRNVLMAGVVDLHAHFRENVGLFQPAHTCVSEASESSGESDIRQMNNNAESGKSRNETRARKPGSASQSRRPSTPTESCEGFVRGTKSAAAGGVTTVFDFPTYDPQPPVTLNIKLEEGACNSNTPVNTSSEMEFSELSSLQSQISAADSSMISGKALTAANHIELRRKVAARVGLWADIAPVGLLQPGPDLEESMTALMEAGAMALVGFLTPQCRGVVSRVLSVEDDLPRLRAATGKLWPPPLGTQRRLVPCMLSPVLVPENELEVASPCRLLKVRERHNTSPLTLVPFSYSHNDDRDSMDSLTDEEDVDFGSEHQAQEPLDVSYFRQQEGQKKILPPPPPTTQDTQGSLPLSKREQNIDIDGNNGSEDGYKSDDEGDAVSNQRNLSRWENFADTSSPPNTIAEITQNINDSDAPYSFEEGIFQMSIADSPSDSSEASSVRRQSAQSNILGSPVQDMHNETQESSSFVSAANSILIAPSALVREVGTFACNNESEGHSSSSGGAGRLSRSQRLNFRRTSSSLLSTSTDSMQSLARSPVMRTLPASVKRNLLQAELDAYQGAGRGFGSRQVQTFEAGKGSQQGQASALKGTEQLQEEELQFNASPDTLKPIQFPAASVVSTLTSAEIGSSGASISETPSPSRRRSVTRPRSLSAFALLQQEQRQNLCDTPGDESSENDCATGSGNPIHGLSLTPPSIAKLSFMTTKMTTEVQQIFDGEDIKARSSISLVAEKKGESIGIPPSSSLRQPSLLERRRLQIQAVAEQERNAGSNNTGGNESVIKSDIAQIVVPRAAPLQSSISRNSFAPIAQQAELGFLSGGPILTSQSMEEQQQTQGNISIHIYKESDKLTRQAMRQEYLLYVGEHSSKNEVLGLRYILQIIGQGRNLTPGQLQRRTRSYSCTGNIRGIEKMSSSTGPIRIRTASLEGIGASINASSIIDTGTSSGVIDSSISGIPKALTQSCLAFHALDISTYQSTVLLRRKQDPSNDEASPYFTRHRSASQSPSAFLEDNIQSVSSAAIAINKANDGNNRPDIRTNDPLADLDPVYQRAQSRGSRFRFSASTPVFALTHSAEDVPLGKTWFKTTPPIRHSAHREALWDALRDGIIHSISSGHSPCHAQHEKHDFHGDFLRACSGTPTLELLLPTVWTEARRRGFSMTNVASWLCSGPAHSAGLSGIKGELRINADADIVILDPDEEYEVSVAALHGGHTESIYSGRTIAGRVLRTFLRGHIVFDYRATSKTFDDEAKRAIGSSNLIESTGIGANSSVGSNQAPIGLFSSVPFGQFLSPELEEIIDK